MCKIIVKHVLLSGQFFLWVPSLGTT